MISFGNSINCDHMKANGYTNKEKYAAENESFTTEDVKYYTDIFIPSVFCTNILQTAASPLYLSWGLYIKQKQVKARADFPLRKKVQHSLLGALVACPIVYLILVKAAALLSVFWNRARIRLFTSELENSTASGPFPSAHLWKRIPEKGKLTKRIHQLGK